MTTGLLLVKTRRQNAHLKATTYTVQVSGQVERQVSPQQPGTQYNLPTGHYVVEVSDGRTTVSKEVAVLVGNPRIVTIDPAMIDQASWRGLLLGFGLIVVVLQLLLMKNPSPSFFLLFIPLLQFWRRKNSQDFALTTSR